MSGSKWCDKFFPLLRGTGRCDSLAEHNGPCVPEECQCGRSRLFCDGESLACLCENLDRNPAALDGGDDRRVVVVFDGPPEREAGRFVEVENMRGESVSAGAWSQRADGYWILGPFLPSGPSGRPVPSSVTSAMDAGCARCGRPSCEHGAWTSLCPGDGPKGPDDVFTKRVATVAALDGEVSKAEATKPDTTAALVEALRGLVTALDLESPWRSWPSSRVESFNRARAALSAHDAAREGRS